MAKKTDPKTAIELVTPAHGHGKLKRGGPSPNSGRRPSALKALAMQGVEQALPNIAALALDPSSDGIAAFNALSKVAGLDGRISPADVKERLRAQVEVIRSRATWSPDELLTALGEVWR